jgi:hypothetical protein
LLLFELLAELVEGRGRLVEHGDGLLGQQLQESRGVFGYQRGHHDEFAPKQERPVHLPHREVKAVGVEQAPGVRGRKVEQGLVGEKQAHHVEVLHQAALGLAR